MSTCACRDNVSLRLTKGRAPTNGSPTSWRYDCSQNALNLQCGGQRLAGFGSLQEKLQGVINQLGLLGWFGRRVASAQPLAARLGQGEVH